MILLPFRRLWLAATIVTLAATPASASPPDTRITIISDAFSRDSRLDLDWGFAALVEYDGKRILFDTGNNAEKFARNVRALGIDLGRLDFVVISHRHGDHTDGLHHLLTVNPTVPIYAADDEYFGGPTPAAFFARPVTSLPKEMRYFGGDVPASVPHGTPWRGASIRRIAGSLELAPGIRLVANISKTPAFSETPEISLVLATPEGPVVLVGCSHPGIEQILGSVDPSRPGVRLVVGGLHLVTTAAEEIDRLGRALRDHWGVRAIAPGHCTGEVAFAALMKAYGQSYTYGGVGTTITVGGRTVGESSPASLPGPGRGSSAAALRR